MSMTQPILGTCLLFFRHLSNSLHLFFIYLIGIVMVNDLFLRL